MPDINRRETGARIPKVASESEPQDEFDQDAAGNQKPAHGVGLSENPATERSETDGSDFQGESVANPPAKDAGEKDNKEMQSHLPEDRVRKTP